VSDVRPVWLTREQRDALGWLLADADMRGVNAASKTRPLGEILTAWDSAPRNALETVRRLLAPSPQLDQDTDEAIQAHAEIILGALGKP
jgi:hypothetical protein